MRSQRESRVRVPVEDLTPEGYDEETWCYDALYWTKVRRIE
jgi:hypothetical protein